MPGKAIICGASIGGLFAAAALRKSGWTVDVYERSSVELSGRGAGIVTHPQLIDALQAVAANTEDLGIPVKARVAIDRLGEEVARLDYHQIVTSWDRLHVILRALVPDEHHHLGRIVTGYEQSGNGATVRFADGGQTSADLVVGADGFRSAIRGQMQPQVQPVYAGYVVWRALTGEAALPKDLVQRLFEQFDFYLPSGTQVLGYPIAGPDNDLSVGNRRYNFVWYVPYETDVLDDMLTDSDGRRHELSIPPPLVRDDVLDEIYKRADAVLPLPFREVLKHSERPFFTPIYDHISPVFAEGHVALAGDAASVARPHVGMGVTKAAQDALALARHLASANVPEALIAYSQERSVASQAVHERAQMLGRLMMAKPEKGDNSDGRNNPNLNDIMRLTAIADF
ncbi:MAG: FAD-dependent monooxygenase [Pseudomonadota bacterium]